MMSIYLKSVLQSCFLVNITEAPIIEVTDDDRDTLLVSGHGSSVRHVHKEDIRELVENGWIEEAGEKSSKKIFRITDVGRNAIMA